MSEWNVFGVWLAPLIGLVGLALTALGLRLGLAVYMGVFGWGALLGVAATYLAMR